MIATLVFEDAMFIGGDWVTLNAQSPARGGFCFYGDIFDMLDWEYYEFIEVVKVNEAF